MSDQTTHTQEDEDEIVYIETEEGQAGEELVPIGDDEP